MSPRVAVVGAGIAGAACATVLCSTGIDVELFDRGRAPGGRLASPEVHGRRVDLGAAYFTVADDDFSGLVDGWQEAGLARPWTDTLDVLGPDGRSTTSGPMRWATPGGLRTLVRDLLPVDVHRREVASLAELDHDAVVLALPDPQAARLVTEPGAQDWVDYQPVVAVAAGWPDRRWDLDAAAFVNGDPDVTTIADDGSRRGDGAPVLVVHSTAERARRHLDDPDAAVGPVLDAARRLLGIDTAPDWTHAHRWTFAQPAGTHGGEPFGLVTVAGRTVGLAGDSWCPQGSPRLEAAWLSGRRLGIELAARLS